tara:strand:+ start:2950 stop:4272 length:1323 start_codon:yes stop_codon:yes gene_type:complete
MSLGGFASGLATAFQRAEDRYQDKKAREEARAEARLARAANQAFQEKMYTRRQKDDYMKEVMNYQSELKAIFGTDQKGLQMVAAVMPMGKYGVEMAKNYQKVSNDRGFTKAEFQDLFEVMYPDGVDSQTFGDVDLNKIVKNMEQNRFADPEDPRVPLSGIQFKFKPLPQKQKDFTELVGSDANQSLMMAEAYLTTLKNKGVTGKQLEQAEAYFKKTETRYNKEVSDALDLAKAKSNDKLNQTKAALEDNLVDTFESYATSAAGDQYTKAMGDRITLNLEGNITPTLMGNLRLAEKQGTRKINSIPDDNTYGNSTYLLIAKDAMDNSILKPQQTVYDALLNKAKDDFKKNKKNLVLIKRKDPETGLYDGLSAEDYRLQLLNTLKENHFYAVPHYKENGRVDLSKEPMYYMHKSVLSKTSPTNELGLKTYLRPTLLIQRTGQ